jgi:hypothetical protein
MALPGFTAEASVGPTTQVYRVQDRYGTAEAASVYGQLNGWGEGLWDEDFGEEGLAEEEGMEMEGEEDTEVGEEVW